MQTELVNGNGDINWIKLLHCFYQKKGFIFLSTLLGFTIGLAVIFFSKPVYEAKIKLNAATSGGFAELNRGRSWNGSFLKPKTERAIYFAFNKELLSESVKEDFFKQYYLAALSSNQKKNSSEAQLWALFAKNFTIVVNPVTASDKFPKYTVAIRGFDAKQVAIWLKQFTDLVKTRTLNTLLSDMKKQNTVIIDHLNQQINIARNTAKAKRLDRMTQLKEKVRIAQLASARNHFWDDEATLMDGPSEAMPVNLDEIQAEIKSLSARKSDDAFAPNLRELQAKLELYKSITVNPDNVSVFNIDGSIERPHEPIAPKKCLIVMVSLVLGFMSGLFLVMFQMAWRKEKLGAW